MNVDLHCLSALAVFVPGILCALGNSSFKPIKPKQYLGWREPSYFAISQQSEINTCRPPLDQFVRQTRFIHYVEKSGVRIVDRMRPQLIPVSVVISIGVDAAADPILPLQDKNLPPGLRRLPGERQPADPRANHYYFRIAHSINLGNPFNSHHISCCS